jgi:hypothetical protein
VCGALRRGASPGAPPRLDLSCQCVAAADGVTPPLDGLQIQFNKNTFGLAPAAALAAPPASPGGPPVTVQLPLSSAAGAASASAAVAAAAAAQLNVAIKSPRSPPPGVVYFNVPLCAEELFLPAAAPFEAGSLATAWRSLPETPARLSASALVADGPSTTARLALHNVFVVHTRQLADGAVALYAGCRLPPAHELVAELTARPGVRGVRVAVRCANADAAAMAAEAIERLLLA